MPEKYIKQGVYMNIDIKKNENINIYQKMLEIKIKFKALNLKKSGHNTYSNYDYYELNDFLSPLIDIMSEYRLVSFVSFSIEYATLTIIDVNNPEEKIIITSPMSTAKLTACHEVQNLGAVETYERRYLYMAAFDIVENDQIDNGQKRPQPAKNQQNVSNNQKQTRKELSEKISKFNDIMELVYDNLTIDDKERADKTKEMIKNNTATVEILQKAIDFISVNYRDLV